MMRTLGLNKRAPRVDLRRRASLVNSDGIDVPVVILDVSSGGFRLEVTDHLRIGEHVTLRVDRGEAVPAQIRWALGSEAGGVFLGPVDYASLQDVEGATPLAEQERRESSDRRQSERRESPDRRKEPRAEDRRKDDRRERERRS